jgi:cystathionine beta-lyase/cystathionine gamma-synthase
MKKIKSRIGNSSLKIHKWNDGKISIELDPHKGEIDCESARFSVGLLKEDVEDLIRILKN